MSHSGYEHSARAMNRLAFLEGSWQGQGWYQAGPVAERRRFTQTEEHTAQARRPAAHHRRPRTRGRRSRAGRPLGLRCRLLRHRRGSVSMGSFQSRRPSRHRSDRRQHRHRVVRPARARYLDALSRRHHRGSMERNSQAVHRRRNDLDHHSRNAPTQDHLTLTRQRQPALVSRRMPLMPGRGNPRGTALRGPTRSAPGPDGRCRGGYG